MKRLLHFAVFAIMVLIFAQCEEPVADFTFDKNNVKAPVTVNFTNTSTGADIFNWNFGDNEVSEAKDPPHEYKIWGNLNVTLTATDKKSGKSNSLTKVLILIPPEPVANFSMSTTRAKVNEIVNFTNTSTYTKTVSWSFGDGTTSTEQNPSHSYPNVGTFTVTLTVIGDGGNATKSLPVEVYLPKPTVSFTISPKFSIVNNTVTFTNQTQSATSYIWNFGDGLTSSAVNPTHAYSKPGIYTVILNATGLGGTDQISSIAYVNTVNGLGDPMNNKNNWIFENCTGTITNGELYLVATTTTSMGIAYHTFPTARITPWEFSVEAGLTKLNTTSGNDYGIIFPISSTVVPLIYVVITRGATTTTNNWGFSFYVAKDAKWYTWDNTTTGYSTAINGNVNELNRIYVKIDASEMITVSCNGVILMNNLNTLNDIEAQLVTDLNFNITEFYLNTSIGETKWDNVYFESSSGSSTIINPIYPNAGASKLDATMKLQGLKSAFETYKKN
jgi:PKD repeat protein